MKRVSRIIGFIGGAAAVVWAMRDRLVSIAAPSEPEPPRFRVVKPPTSTDLSIVNDITDDLTMVSGIGPVFAARLRAAGLDSFEKLSNSDDDTIATIVGVTESRVYGWRDQASKL